MSMASCSAAARRSASSWVCTPSASAATSGVRSSSVIWSAGLPTAASSRATNASMSGSW